MRLTLHQFLTLDGVSQTPGPVEDREGGFEHGDWQAPYRTPEGGATVASKHGLAGLAEAVFLDVRDRDVKVSLISPGIVAAGASLATSAAQHRPHELLAPADIAAAVRFVATFPVRGCPTHIQLQPQRTPD